ncbi:TatD family hydrolase [Taibaiella koreensis]|uniref:TatD family hydrolase n=1 Tax=Taibaiella koreensis TaxID=1268548 RepID=UPI000E599C47|nr:TatD family hydrolase [Taibaiella koreensis]
MTPVFTDTHTHLYDRRFDDDRAAALTRCLEAGVTRLYLPNCDSETIAPMMAMVAQWPEQCSPMMGIHPCYIKENYKEELAVAESWLSKGQFAAVGEIGLDYYWDKTFVAEQKEAFNTQMDWALNLDLPIVIHTRESMRDGIDMVRAKQNGKLRGIFHCFGGSQEEAREIIDLGFYLGIGGVATFAKSTLPEVLAQIPLEHIVLETDAPYLAPVPYRGKRNESAYIPLIGTKIAAIKNCSVETVAAVTTENARRIFG